MRQAVRSLRQLAEQEKQKGAGRVEVYRVRQIPVMTRGWLPHLQVRERLISYLLLAIRGRDARVYFCDGLGRPVGGENFEVLGKPLKSLLKRCRLVFSL